MAVEKQKGVGVAVPEKPKGAAAIKKLMEKSRAVHPSTKVGKGGLKGKYLCLCGCGGRTDFTFLRGHVQRVRGWLVRARAGEGQPTNLGMPLALAQKLGPWKKKGDGLVPSKKYDTLVR